MSFKVGDHVYIKPGSRYYGRLSAGNPSNIIGTVIRANAYLSVRWSDGVGNTYQRSDLEHAKVYWANKFISFLKENGAWDEYQRLSDDSPLAEFFAKEHMRVWVGGPFLWPDHPLWSTLDSAWLSNDFPEEMSR